MKKLNFIFLLSVLHTLCYAQIRNVEVVIDTKPQNHADVKVTYFLDSIPESIKYKFILFCDSEIKLPGFISANKKLRVVNHEENEHLLSGTILPDNSNGKIVVTYQVPADNNDFEIPIIIFELPPPPSSNSKAFDAKILTHGDLKLIPAFPNIDWLRTSQGHKFSLRVIPAKIAFSQAPGDQILISSTFFIDMLVFVVLLILIALGWRRIKTVQS
ncbi:MAG: hypothetical protein RJQ09_15075 [Cyclobacteriaceae bacterium]